MICSESAGEAHIKNASPLVSCTAPDDNSFAIVMFLHFLWSVVGGENNVVLDRIGFVNLILTQNDQFPPSNHLSKMAKVQC